LTEDIAKYQFVDVAEKINFKLTDCETSIKSLGELQNELDRDISQYIAAVDRKKRLPDIEAANILIKEIEDNEPDYETVETLQREVNIVTRQKEGITRYKKIKEAEPLIERILSVQKRFEKNTVLHEALEEDITRYKQYKGKLKEIISRETIDHAKELIAGILETDKRINQYESNERILREAINNFDIQSGVIAESVAEIVILKTKLPDICPVCGGKINKGIQNG
jgi:DNA polymerase II large subunit